MRWSVLLSLLAVGCASPSAANEHSLRRWLRDPVAEREARAQHLRREVESTGDTPLRPGVRLAAAHHALRMQQNAPAVAWLDAEAGAHPGASQFLATYRKLMQVSGEPPRAARDGRVLLVLVQEQDTPRDALADALATLERPLRDRGYYVVPLEVSMEFLDLLGGELRGPGRSVAEPPALRRLHELGVDAVLWFEIGRLWVHASLAVDSAQFELRYSLLDTATGQVRWQRPLIGSYDRRNPVRGYSSPDDDETFFYPSSLAPGYSSQLDLIRALCEGAVMSVPEPKR